LGNVKRTVLEKGTEFLLWGFPASGTTKTGGGRGRGQELEGAMGGKKGQDLAKGCKEILRGGTKSQASKTSKGALAEG